MSEIFEKAARLKLRWDSPAGQLSVEELWELPLQSTTKKANLDDMAIALNRDLKESTTESFVKKSATTSRNETNKLKFDIVYHIIQVRQSEAEAAALKQENAAKKQKLLELLAKKQDAALEGKSVDEIQALINAL